MKVKYKKSSTLSLIGAILLTLGLVPFILAIILNIISPIQFGLAPSRSGSPAYNFDAVMTGLTATIVGIPKFFIPATILVIAGITCLIISKVKNH